MGMKLEAQTALAALKDWLLTAPILSYSDPQGTYILDTDASDDGIGAVLSQVQNDKERVTGYYSKTHAPAECSYRVTWPELLVVVKAVKHYRP